MGMPISCVKIRKIQPARAPPNFSWIDCLSFYFVSAQPRNLRISLRGTPFPPDADSLASSAACPGQGKIWGFAPSGFLSGFPYKSTPKHAKAGVSPLSAYNIARSRSGLTSELGPVILPLKTNGGKIERRI